MKERFFARVSGAVKEVRENPAVQKILALRALLVCSFIAVTATCTTLAYSTLHENEISSFGSKFEAVSQGALSRVENRFLRMNQGVQVLANTYSHLYPDASEWPNVAWLGFNPVASLLGPMSSMDNVAMIPLLQPEQIAMYETFLNIFYDNNPYVDKSTFGPPNFSNISIWATNTSDPNAVPYHDLTGEVPYSDNTVLTPIAQYTLSRFYGPYSGAYNMHSHPLFAGFFDRAIDCATENNQSFASTSCGMLSDVIPFPYATPADPDPDLHDMVALTIFPIFPYNNQTELTGFAAGSISWIELLASVVPRFVGDVDCVVETDTSVFTVSIQDGDSIMVGVGDLHDTKYSDYKSSSMLYSTGVKLTIYPTQDFADEYITGKPLYQAMVLLAAFLFCAFVFFCYDVLMHREFSRGQAVLDTKRRFVRFISHEIRTPLNTVRLGLKLYESELHNLLTQITATPLEELAALVTSTVQGWAQLTKDIADNSESAVEVLTDLLNYDRIEMGTMRLDFAVFNFGNLINRVVSTMQLEAQRKQISLNFTLRPGEETAAVQQSTVIGDETRLGQVLRNLVSNALKFTPTRGTVTLSVERVIGPVQVPARTQQQSTLFRNHTAMGVFRVSIKDSGAGFTPKQLSQICNDGVQFDAGELQAGQGSGLGLFISKGTVEQHGGKMTVASEGLGLGATFTVELPYFQAADRSSNSFTSLKGASSISRSMMSFSGRIARGATILSAPNSPRPSPRTNSVAPAPDAKRLLVVDDSHFNRKMLVRLLEGKGYVCEQAEDGMKGLMAYTAMKERGEPADAVLMDFEMPVMNGPTATKQLREMGCNVLIVGVTGNVLPDEVAFFKQQGADDVLHKPLVLEDFEKLLAEPRKKTPPSELSVNLEGGLSNKVGYVVSPAATVSSKKVHPMLYA